MTTYHGSCFCGAVAFGADGDLCAGTMRCNCRFCRKMRYWEMVLPNPDGLRVLKGADHLAETPVASPEAHHRFCKTCGTRLWTEANIPPLGGRTVLVCVSALDDIPVGDLARAPIHYANGAEDDWFNSPTETRHL